jgi:LacI family transcriptional regulator
MSSQLTIKDIARLANVSQSTVSKALNCRPDVGEETRKRILQIAEEHEFTPNAFGKGLKGRFTENIGVIFRRENRPLSSNPFYSRVLEGVEAETALNNFNLVLHMVPEDQPARLPKMVKERQVDGVILVGIQHEEFVDLLKSAGIPIVLVDPKRPETDCSQVLIDNENGAYIATQHLLDKGHSRIGFVSGELSRLSFKQRFDGYVKALKKAGIAIDRDLVATGGIEAGYEHTRKLLALDRRPTAIFATNDLNAIYGYRAIAEAGLKIPDDISVVGFDDIDLANMASPSLTTVRVYKEELGSVAVRALRDLVLATNSSNETTLIPVKLIERSSVRKIWPLP